MVGGIFKNMSRGEETEDLIVYQSLAMLSKPIMTTSKLLESSHCCRKLGGEIQSRGSHLWLPPHFRTHSYLA